MDSAFVQPYLRGDIEMNDLRLELVRRSSVLFAEDLPALQLHHGDSDETVAVTQAYSMIRAMEALGRETSRVRGLHLRGWRDTSCSP